MKIVHTSDWHLGKIFHDRSLIEDQEYALEQIIKYIAREAYDVLLISGDIYDRSLPPAEAVTIFSSFLTRLRAVSDCKVLVIPGNHDSAARLSYCAPLMEHAGVYFRTDPLSVDQPITVSDGKQEVDFFLVPFLPPNSFAQIDQGTERRTHQSEIVEALRRIKKVQQPGRKSVLAAHLFTAGSSSADSERALVGSLVHVSADLLSGFDYVALGHLHKPQTVDKQIYYSGSLLQYSFSEVDDIKRFLSVELDGDCIHIDSIQIEPLRKMVRLEDSFLTLLNDEKYEGYDNHYVEVVLIDGKIVPNPVEQLRERFPLLSLVRQKAVLAENDGQKIELKRGVRTLVDDYNSFTEFLYGEADESKRRLFETHCDEGEQS